MDKEYLRYKDIVVKKANQTFLERVSGRNGILFAIVSVFFGAIISLVAIKIWDRQVTMNDVAIVIMSSVIAPVFSFVALWVCEFVFAHFRVFIEKENEADKLNWNRVSIEPVFYSPNNIHEMSLKVTNDKPYPISDFAVSVVTRQDEEKILTPYNPPLKIPLIVGRQYNYTPCEVGEEPVNFALVNTEPSGSENLKTAYIPVENNSLAHRSHLEIIWDERPSANILEVQFTGRIENYSLPVITRFYIINFEGSKLVVKPYKVNEYVKG